MGERNYGSTYSQPRHCMEPHLLSPWESVTGAHYLEGCVDLKADLDILEKGRAFCTCWEIVLGAQYLEGCVDLKADLDILEKGRDSCTCWDTVPVLFVVQPADWSLSWLITNPMDFFETLDVFVY
jgi:hypothetical protein